MPPLRKEDLRFIAVCGVSVMLLGCITLVVAMITNGGITLGAIGTVMGVGGWLVGYVAHDKWKNGGNG